MRTRSQREPDHVGPFRPFGRGVKWWESTKKLSLDAVLRIFFRSGVGAVVRAARRVLQ